MIDLVKVKDKAAGQVKAHELLKKLTDPTTLLALSGGTSMDYRVMLGIGQEEVSQVSTASNVLKKEKIIPGAICVVDERYGEQFHPNSNEKLLLDAGIKNYTDEKCIETRKILVDEPFENLGPRYSKIVEDLFSRFPKRVGVMGVGTNLHTAGIFPHSVAVHSPHYAESEIVDDTFSKRITITLKALGEFTNFIVMMFGKEKKESLKLMLDETENDMQKYPAIFYRKDPIKTYLVTDIEL